MPKLPEPSSLRPLHSHSGWAAFWQLIFEESEKLEAGRDANSSNSHKGS